jgi:hypothetical protein
LFCYCFDPAANKVQGGAQNIGKKIKEKEEKKKQAKSGGFRGLKGIV